jgi:hypothetical protein
LGEEEKRKRERRGAIKKGKGKRKNDGAGGQARRAVIGLRDGWMELVTETVR